MEEQDPKAEEVIFQLLALIEDQVVANLALRETLDLLWEWYPKGKLGGETLGLEPLIDQQKRELAPRVADKFHAIRAGWLEWLAQNPPRLPEGWEEDVRRLIEGE